MSVPGSIVSAFSRPSLATIVVIPSSQVKRVERVGRNMRSEYGECVSVGRIEGWEKVRIVGV